jgi:hypothetical protein
MPVLKALVEDLQCIREAFNWLSVIFSLEPRMFQLTQNTRSEYARVINFVCRIFAVNMTVYSILI